MIYPTGFYKHLEYAESSKYTFRASKTDTLSVAEAKRKALIEGRVRKLSDQVHLLLYKGVQSRIQFFSL